MKADQRLQKKQGGVTQWPTMMAEWARWCIGRHREALLAGNFVVHMSEGGLQEATSCRGVEAL